MDDRDVAQAGSESPPQSDIWSRAEPRSLISLLPDAVAQAFIAMADKRPELFGLDEQTLLKALKELRANPTATDNRLRLNFWNEYDRAQAEASPKMEIARVVAGICPRQYFYAEYLKRPEKVAWLITRPADYEVFMKEALTFGLEQLREILELPLYEMDPNTGDMKLNLKVAELKAKIVTMIDQRVKGSVVQQIKQTNLNLNVPEKAVAQAAMAGTVEELQRRLSDLNKRDRLAAPPELPKEEA